MTTHARHAWWAPYFFLAPFLVIFCTFTAYPLVQSLLLSLQQTHGPGLSRYVGLDNFRYLWSDPLFWQALQNTAIFAIGSIVTQFPFALALALLLNRPALKQRALFRLIFFSPSLVGLVFVGLLFSLILEKHTGLLNVLLHHLFHFNLDFPWLEDYIRPALILAALWMYSGFQMVYFLAALQNVSPELLEAAEVDGANAFHRFLHITLPAIRPVASFVILLSLLGSFQLFELPFVIFLNSGNENGPHNQALTVVMYLYQHGFEMGDLGYASAIGWVLAILLFIFGMSYRVVTRGDDK